jgi:hypothetical protein
VAPNPQEARFHCALCGAAAGHVTWDGVEIRFDGPGLIGEQVRAPNRSIVRALAAACPATELARVFWPLVTGRCFTCELAYCRQHWLATGGGVEGRGRRDAYCPAGHQRTWPGHDDY